MNAGAAIHAMAGLPFAPIEAVLGPAGAVILAPHADDESLGCGGLIALAAGRRIHVILLTDGTGSHPHSRAYPPDRLRAVREQEAADALAILGLDPQHLTCLRMKDTALPGSGAAFDEAVETVARIAASVGAGVVLAPWEHDPHCDHEAAHRIARAVCKRHGPSHWAYPVWGLTLPEHHDIGDAPIEGVRIDIGAVIDQKRRAIAAHRTQYAGLITDDPSGFQLPPALLQWFERPFETFLRVR